VNSFTTPHSEQTFLPASERRGIALCLSGGGFRAALFHLGALRRLNELGVLGQVDTISSVSGGSIVSAHIATKLRWPIVTVDPLDWNVVAQTFRAFTSTDLRTHVILKRALPWNWFDSTTGVKGLEAAYESRLTSLRLAQLPERPRFVFCSTDMAYGVAWVFERDRAGDYQAGYLGPTASNWPLARAVAASSCFPPVFDPMPIDVDPAQLTGGNAPLGRARDACINGLRLSDGGVYDNMGLEPVWKSAATVLVSDGGGIFAHSGDDGLFWRLNRYVDIQGSQAEALRKRWLMSNFNEGAMTGAYWGIGSSTDHYGPNAPAGYSEPLVTDRISKVRTDLDAFSQAEASVLENHGYLLADAAIKTHVPQLVTVDAALAVPNLEWMNEPKVNDALKDSNKRKLPFGRS
jgi:NTE family protein